MLFASVSAHLKQLNISNCSSENNTCQISVVYITCTFISRSYSTEPHRNSLSLTRISAHSEECVVLSQATFNVRHNLRKRRQIIWTITGKLEMHWFRNLKILSRALHVHPHQNVCISVMTSSSGNISRTKASDAEFWCFLRPAPWINGCANNRGAGDLGRYRVHYDVIVMISKTAMCVSKVQQWRS